VFPDLTSYTGLISGAATGAGSVTVIQP
jgi:hypothetical protein